MDMPCPNCKGKKVEFLLLHHKPYAAEIECQHCLGKGVVSEDMYKWIEQGKIISERRRQAKLVLRQGATFLKMDVCELSRMERGVIKPDMSINYSKFRIFEK